MRLGRLQATGSRQRRPDWRTDRISSRATASSIGLSGASSNQFTFRQRPTTDWILVKATRPVTEATCGVRSREVIFDAKLEAGQVGQSLKLRATTDSLDADTMQRFRTTAKTQMENVWNNGFSGKKFHRRNCRRGSACDYAYDCCKAGFRLNVSFVDAADHWRVIVVAQAGPDAPPGL